MIYFVRHGESEGNAMGETSAFCIPNEWLDPPLTEKGRQQARETAEKLRDKKIDVVVTSKLKRAQETGKIINKYHGVSVIEVDELNERRDDRAEVVERGDREWHNSFDFGYEANPDIENLEKFRDRVISAIEKVRNEFGDKDVLVVAHHGVSHIFRRYFNGEPWEGNIRITMMRNAEVVEFDFEGLG